MSTQNDTIVAISTAPGVGGIAVIRISGPEAIPIVSKLFRPKRSTLKLSEMRPWTCAFGKILDIQGEELDEIILTMFHGPNSFTGEDLIELSCHGSIYVQQQVLLTLVQGGCRLAQPGEYTRRAFLNGRIDLSQAEAVGDLIAARSRSAHRLALSQMKGHFGQAISTLREQLLHFTSLIELELDFSDHEDLEFADRKSLKKLADEIAQEIWRLRDSFAAGNAIKNGIPVAIVGETNAGKSTLLNLLCGEEKAIVSQLHGTTRDLIEDEVILQGVLFRFIDTAGIRQTSDPIEKMGIDRTYHAIEQAHIVIWVVDGSAVSKHITDLAEVIKKRIDSAKQKPHLIIALNKSDTFNTSERETLFNEFIDYEKPVFISAKYGDGTEELKRRIFSLSDISTDENADITVTNIRHFDALRRAGEAIERVQKGMNCQLSGDLLAEDLRDCIQALGEITGEITSDEVLGNIFKNFCVGK